MNNTSRYVTDYVHVTRKDVNAYVDMNIYTTESDTTDKLGCTNNGDVTKKRNQDSID